MWMWRFTFFYLTNFCKNSVKLLVWHLKNISWKQLTLYHVDFTELLIKFRENRIHFNLVSNASIWRNFCQKNAMEDGVRVHFHNFQTEDEIGQCGKTENYFREINSFVSSLLSRNVCYTVSTWYLAGRLNWRILQNYVKIR